MKQMPSNNFSSVCSLYDGAECPSSYLRHRNGYSSWQNCLPVCQNVMHIMAIDFHNAMQIKVAFCENKVSIHPPCEALPRTSNESARHLCKHGSYSIPRVMKTVGFWHTQA